MKKGLIGKTLELCLLMVAIVLAFCGSVEAKPTISGTLMNYNPGGGRLQIKRADGVIKTIVMRNNAIYALNGVEGSPYYFKNGMQVAVRICGSITSDPLVGDLLIDAYSSGKVVQRSASSYSGVTSGTMAGVSSGNGIPGVGTFKAPSVVGAVGLGGGYNNNNFININKLPDANLAVNTLGPNPVNQGALAASLMGGNNSTSGQANGANEYNPYDNRQAMGGMTTSSSGTNAGMAAMMGGDEAPADEQQEEANGSFTARQAGSGPLGMQIAQIQGGIVGVDPRNRVISVVPRGALQPVQVKVPAGIPITNTSNGQAVTFESLNPGQAIIVAGMSNAAGIIEARQLTVTQ